MKHLISTIILFTVLSTRVIATEYIFTVSGEITDRFLSFPDPSISIGSPFSATFVYQLPGTPVNLDEGLGWYSFTDNQQQGRATIGNMQYSFTGGNLLIWHEGSSYSTLELECQGDGLCFRPVLSTTDLALLADTTTVPSSLQLANFDYRREFQVFSAWPGNVSIAGRIDSFTLTVVPEPGELTLIAIGLFVLVLRRHHMNQHLASQRPQGRRPAM